MKNIFRKGLTLLMVLCLLVPLFGLSVLAADTPADYQFTEVKESSISSSLKGISNDPFSALQWNLKTIGMEEAWRSGLTGKGVVVAIVDSGLSDMTMDIDRDRILPGKNCVGGTGVTDTIGHGTFVAGIIGATKDNGVGIAGVAPGVTIVPLKTSTDGSSNTRINSQAIYAAVEGYVDGKDAEANILVNETTESRTITTSGSTASTIKAISENFYPQASGASNEEAGDAV